MKQNINIKDKNGVELFEDDRVLPCGYNEAVTHGIIVWNTDRAGWDIAINGDKNNMMSADRHDHFYKEDFERCEKI